MILTVTLNPAWDVTYPVNGLRPGTTHRVSQPAGRAGGKGVNVARVLKAMGRPALASGVLLGDTGRAVAADLDAAGVPASFLSVGDGGDRHRGHRDRGRTRSTVTIVDTATGQATVFNEPGPGPGAVDWPALRGHLLALIARSAVVVLSGSLPPALPDDAYAELIDASRALGARTILDSDGAGLTAALAARPDIVKPNRDELARATGTSDLRRGAAALLAAGAGAVVVSDGPAGMLAVSRGAMGLTALSARPPALDAVNPTGAGDAAVAALASCLLADASWPLALRTAVAWSSASVLEPVAGAVAPHEARRLAGLVDVRSLDLAVDSSAGESSAGESSQGGVLAC
jgi:tagatose 6-phosphate kinase